ncbi:caffeoyl-CoA O-methyltransferase [Bacilli bacterium]|nr:caffeoyl-CoA O-methyltransferase [Bacilli bacterium]
MNIKQLKKICLDERIPIIRDDTLNLIIHLIQDNDFHSVLEIGTAYGYSTKAFSIIIGIKEVTSLELNPDNYQKAISYLNDESKIKLINVNAFDFKPEKTYDFIFIDGPKSHQEKLVTKYLTYLNQRGIMIVDNIFLKKFQNQTTLTKNQQSLLNKVRAFKQ